MWRLQSTYIIHMVASCDVVSGVPVGFHVESSSRMVLTYETIPLIMIILYQCIQV